MNTPSGTPATEARRAYEERLARLAAERTRLRGRDRLFGIAKLALAACTLTAGFVLARAHPAKLAWTLLPACAFAVLWLMHERLLRRSRTAARLESFYQRGVLRLQDQWHGAGDPGERFFQASHPYARDLDIFGKGSLYELLAQAVTAPGEHRLAEWLLAAADQDEVMERQQAVRELAPRLVLRETLALAGDDAVREGTPETLIAWAESPATTLPRWMPWLAPVLGSLWLAALVLWLAGGKSQWCLLLCLVNGVVLAQWMRPAYAQAAAALGIAPLLRPIVRVLAVFEAEPFTSPRLIHLREALKSGGLPPSRVMGRLLRTMEYLESSENWFVKLADRFLFWTPLCVMVLDRWRSRHGARMRVWLDAIGDFEALSSLACFCFERPDCCFPSLTAAAPALTADSLRHPLLTKATAIPNDLTLDRSCALIIVSGPNMAGKSTLLRAVGLNVVLAQCGAPACCRSLTLSRLAMGASITVEDSLQGGLSRFYAEIRRLKQITDLAAGPHATLFLFDELLSGTNSHDRRTGTEALLKSLLGKGAIGMITTHDLALTEMAASLHAVNMHFGDRFSAGALHFDYRLTPGIANSTNALALMRSIGLEV